MEPILAAGAQVGTWKADVLWTVTFVVLPCLGALAAWAALRTPRLDGWTPRRWTVLALVLFLLTRVGVHLTVFHWPVGYAGGHDLIKVWTPIARCITAGEDPSVYIDNLYGPLFPHVLAAGWGLWGTILGFEYPPGIDTVFVLADGLGLVLLLRIARRTFEEAVARRLVLATLLSPLLWHGVVVRTQDEALFLFFLLWSLDRFQAGGERSGVVVAALGTVFTKALFPLFVFPVLLAAGGGPRRIATRTVAAGALTVAAVGAFVLSGWNLEGRFHDTLGMRGSSTWFLVLPAGGVAPWAFRAGLLLTAAGCVLAAMAAALPPRPGEESGDRATRGVLGVQSTFFVLGPFTLPPHLVHGLPFLAWQAVREGVCRPRPPLVALVLGGLFVLWQIPSLAVNSELWHHHPWLIAALAAWCAWTGWVAFRPRRDADPVPGNPPP